MATSIANDDVASDLRAAKAGDRAALARVLEVFRPFLLKIAGDELDSGLRVKGGASDVVQEAMLEAQQAFAQFRGQSNTQLLAWLRRILRNNLIDQARRYREAAARDIGLERSLDRGESQPLQQTLASNQRTPLQVLLALEKRADLEACMQNLPAEFRRAIELRSVENQSFEQVGQALGKSAEAARKVWFRALARLRQEMKAHEESGL